MAWQASSLDAVVTVTYPDSNTSGLVDVPSTVVLREALNQHMLTKINYIGSPEYYRSTLLTGAPVLINTSSRSGRLAIHGYIASITPKQEGPTESTQVTVLGVTYPMKATDTKVWGPTSVASIMNQLIYKYGLVPFVEDTGMFQEVPQAGRTDFELLNDLAEMAGLDVFVSGTTVHCLSPMAAMYFFHDAATRLRKVGTSGILSNIDSLDSFNQSTTQLSRTQVQGQVIDPISAQMYVTRVGEGLFVDQGATIVANSRASLDAKVAGKALRREYPYQAVAQGPGNMLIRAGRPVFVDYNGDQNWWLTKSVTHTFTPGSKTHTMDMALHRPDGDTGLTAPGYTPKRGILRNVPNYCFCRENDPDLVGLSKATFITNQVSTPGTDPSQYAWMDVQEWTKQSPLGSASPTFASPRGAWSSLRRWRGKGRCA